MTPIDGIAVIIPSRSPSVATATPQASAKKCRPRKTEDGSNATSFAAPSSYTTCRCDWEKCPAELHSLETLRKHVRKHCRAIDGVYPCLWADCSDSSNPIPNVTELEDGQRRQFKTDEEWIKHVESSHLRTESEVVDGASVNPVGKLLRTYGLSLRHRVADNLSPRC